MAQYQPRSDSATESIWDVLAGGRINSGLNIRTVREMVLQRKIDQDDMVRKDGGEWKRISDFPELTTLLTERKVATQRQLTREYSYLKVLAIAIPVSAVCALPAPLYDPFIESGAQYLVGYLIALVYYEVFGVGMALFMNYFHHLYIQRGNRWGFWRYSKAGMVGVIGGAIMLVTFAPPMFPLFLPVVNHLLTGLMLIMITTMFFKMFFEKKLQFED
ncbi:MAG: hypothetical protein JXQ27_14225 [Acidobacteria bacterium]|nr:hypothetical protein [Acidobacteriota bacterium]